MARPRVFIGSSVESKAIAEAFADQIDRKFEHKLWSDGVFSAGSYNLSALKEVSKNVECAVIVLDNDDVTTSRDETMVSPRDNVIFELGLFMGALPDGRVFFLVPRERKNLKLPSDLLGITPLEYDNDRSDKNLTSATGSAARQFIDKNKSLIEEFKNKPVAMDAEEKPSEVSIQANENAKKNSAT